MPLESMGKMPLEKLRPRNMEEKKATKTLLSIVAFSTLSHLTFTPLANAGPDGGNLVGGSGSIDTSGLTTNIIQSSASMAIDWNSYNLSSNEVVNYLQPNASSISLNRILSSDASQIYGQINANGQVVLVNPNGIFFGETASINVGGLIASGLDISPTDFMNGDYIFNQVIGTGGTVINSGLINASLGGNVTLLAKQVANKGVINAKLGAVNLAAGKEAVLTFDNQGLIGVQITKEVLQEELGVDPAVLNRGEINTNGGRVLLTSSVSRDVFSDAVNHGDQQQASSVVVHEDGSFTLGGGADVVNSGTINVSAEASNDAGQVVILGENITHTGSIHADSKSGPVGMVELHSMDTTELRGDALISAQASLSEIGGQIKILGEKVGLYDTSEINASGIHGGGEILVGGDRLGFNSLVRNAKFLYLGENSNIFADAITDGNGGRIITYASDTGRFYGGLYARGGVLGGDGGFIETSGKKGFELPVAPDVSAASGEGGLWLIDPYDITIQSSGGPSTYIEDIVTSPPDTFYTSIDPGLASTSTIDVAVIEIALGSGNVEIITDASDGGGQAGNIIFAAGLNYDGVESKSLTLNAAGGITFINGSSISDIDDKDDSLNVNLYAIGDVLMGTVIIDTQGGNLTVGGSGGNTPASFINNGTIDTTGWENIAGGDISITANDTITSTALTANGGTASNNHDGTNAGAITLHAVGAISVTGDISAIGSDGNEGGGGGDQWVGGSGGIISVASSATSVTTGNINNYGGNADGGGGANANGGNAGNITLSSQVGGGSITLTGRITSYGGTELGSGTTGNKSDITLDGNVTLANSLVLDVNSFSSGNLNARGAVDSIGSNIDITSSTNITTGSITTSGGSASLNSAGNNAGFISLDATNNINVNGAIYSSGSAANAMGNGGDAGLVYLLSGGQTSVSDITALGGIGVASDGSTADTTIATQTLNFNGVAAQTISGNDVLITASNGATLQQSLALYATSNATLNTNGNDINYHGIGTAGSLAMTAGNDIILNGNLVDTIVPDTDKLTVTLTANDDENGIGDINVTGTITTNGGEFTATGVNYDGFSNTSVDTGSSNAFIAMTDAVALGGMDIGGTLDITASGGNISQSSDGIAVIGTTTLT
ncbi:MAG: filamentous hemagglutinin N-terminal domain-containing protein, partial [Gammaproteobacteria bacterium]|nr:filamentous hemagglutinin N-terminal domain-containing protein [Gammaproteobacteria bacterium]